MEALLIFPDPAPPTLLQTLESARYPYFEVRTAEEAQRKEPEDGWSGAVICADAEPEEAFALCRALRRKDVPVLVQIPETCIVAGMPQAACAAAPGCEVLSLSEIAKRLGSWGRRDSVGAAAP